MKSIEPILEAERAYGGSREISALLARAQTLREDTSLPRIALVGSAGAGKTTLLNAAVGAQVREPQIFEKDPRPLRVTFARREADARCDCAETVSANWAEAADAVYEMDLPLPPTTDADGAPGLAEDIDCWFFVVNASMPMTKSETDALGSLQPKATIVLINRMDLVRPDERDRVVQFITAYCQKLGLAEPLCLPEGGTDSPNVGQLLRGLTPDEEGLARLRADHADRLTETARALAGKQLRAALEANESARQTAMEARGADDLTLQKKKVSWSAVRADLLSRSEKLCGRITETLRARQDDLTEKLESAGATAGYTPEWCQRGLPREAGRAMREILAGCEDDLVSQVDKDVAAALSKAADLDLTPENLKLRAGDPAAGLTGSDHGKLSLADKTKLAAFSAAAIGGISFFPAFGLGSAMTVMATAVAAMTANDIYKKAKTGSWHEALYAYAGECVDRLCHDIREQVTEHYRHVAQAVSRYAASQQVVFDAAPFDDRKAELEAALTKLEEN